MFLKFCKIHRKMSEFLLSKITGQETQAEVKFCGFGKKLFFSKTKAESNKFVLFEVIPLYEILATVFSSSKTFFKKTITSHMRDI